MLQNPSFWNNHKSYRFTLPQTPFKTQTVVEGFGPMLKAAIHAQRSIRHIGLEAAVRGNMPEGRLRAEINISWIDLKVHHICRSFIKFPYIETKFLAPNSPPKNAPLT